VNGQPASTEIFDFFLCHNGEDKTAVQEISYKLRSAGVKPWLDIEQIPPGASWRLTLDKQIKTIKSAAVFIGRGGLGPWQSEEIQGLLNEFTKRKCPIIPSILPGTIPEMPWYLGTRHWVDFRTTNPNPSNNY
jgi:hypothetical protein